MKTWKHAPSQMLCGGPCRQFIAKGEPYLEILAPEWKRPKTRCPHCAGEPVRFEQPPTSDEAKRERIQQATAGAMQRLTGGYQPAFGLQEES